MTLLNPRAAAQAAAAGRDHPPARRARAKVTGPGMDDSVPAWVEDELWNWSRWCWQGAWPHPMPMRTCGSCERAYPSGLDRDDDDEAAQPMPLPVNDAHARRLDQRYRGLAHVAQRVIQAEYPRRGEYGDKRRHERHTLAAHQLGISVATYQAVLAHFKQQVWREFR